MTDPIDPNATAHVTVVFCQQCCAAINKAVAEDLRERCIAMLDWQLIEALQ